VSGINIQVHHYPPPDTGAIVRELGITDVRWSVEGGLGVGALARAAQIVDAGICDAVVVCKIMNTIAPVNVPDIDPRPAGSGHSPVRGPLRLGYTMQRVGFLKRRWMHRYGITDDQVAGSA